MAFIGIDAVVFRAPRMAEARRFFTDWGLNKLKDNRSGTVFKTEIGSEVVLRRSGTKDLPEVIWGVSSKRHLAEIARELSHDRELRVDNDGTIHTTDPNGLGIGFRVWRHKRSLKPSRTPVNTAGAPERIDQRSHIFERASPLRIGHVVFVVPDLKAGEKFYTERLGFRVSDRYVGQAVFMRCTSPGDHHNLFFINGRGANAALHHVAFEVRDVHEVMGGGLAFGRKGWATEVGPGRHPISSAYFWYFKNPCGGAVEYFSDSDYVTEAWKPASFRKVNFSEWHLADGRDQAGGGAPSMAADK